MVCFIVNEERRQVSAIGRQLKPLAISQRRQPPAPAKDAAAGCTREGFTPERFTPDKRAR